jgi:transglutaminase-like putative cysteine protease
LIGLKDQINQIEQIGRIFKYVYNDIRPARFSGTTSAVLACKLGEASCNGKSRLMVALCRHVGIP